MAKLDASERANLPDTAFAYVDPRGRRMLPIHDEAHVRNALARFNQVSFDDEASRQRARKRLLNAAKKFGIVPVGFITSQLESERERAGGGDRDTPLPSGFVTMLLTDVEGSTALLHHLGDRYGELLDGVRTLQSEAATASGGHVIETRADEFFAVFAAPAAAISAAVSIQRLTADRPWPEGVTVRIRAGVHSGYPTLAKSNYLGMAVHTAARICDVAHGGQILTSGNTRTALEGQLPDGSRLRKVGTFALRGLPDEVDLYQVSGPGLATRFPPPRNVEVTLARPPSGRWWRTPNWMRIQRMSNTIDASVSAPARIAEPGEAISLDELRLATRNHGLPLEMLCHDVTPPGLHYLLVHYDIPVIDPATYRLRVGGHVERPLELDLPALLDLPQTRHTVTLECAGNGRARLDPRPVSQPWLDEAVGTAQWTGTPLASLLDEAGIADGAVDVVFTGADHGVERGVEQDYQRALPVAEARRPDVLLAHAMNGEPLPPQHGAPLRLIVPGWYGMAHVKWLVDITVLDTPFTGYQNETTYRIKNDSDDAGEPVTRIQPRALIAPPGFPDFQTRTRIVDRGTHQITGRAWSGVAPISRVEVSDDGGASWHEATLGAQPEQYAWCRWEWTWKADTPGAIELWARATDAAGTTQPIDQAWNVQAMANNHVQRVAVFVR